MDLKIRTSEDRGQHLDRSLNKRKPAKQWVLKTRIAKDKRTQEKTSDWDDLRI
jgi:hypothetical protein